MENPLFIKAITDVPACAEDVPACLDSAGIEWHELSFHNWADRFPYKPAVRFRIAHTGSHLLLHYDVSEESIRAEATADDGPVWEDSCCEFFFQPDTEKPTYYNIECNCAGTLLVRCGDEREGREHAPGDVLQAVGRWSSLGRQQRPLTEGHCHWQLALLIPVGTFYRHQLETLCGLSARCNLYKCGDRLIHPHFLSWKVVGTPKPDFHRQDFFGPCHFE